MGLVAAIAVISGAVCWFGLASGRANPSPHAAPNVSDLTEVTEDEIAGALSTMSLSNAAVVQFREAKDGGCPRPLAWVSVVSPPGEAGSRIRLISGTYFSPVFEVSATPVRIALPFPAPYDTGHGVLSAIAVGGGATISLIPSWRVSAQNGRTTHAVAWHPTKNCGARNG